jgi:hypothetical protein
MRENAARRDHALLVVFLGWSLVACARDTTAVGDAAAPVDDTGGPTIMPDAAYDITAACVSACERGLACTPGATGDCPGVCDIFLADACCHPLFVAAYACTSAVPDATFCSSRGPGGLCEAQIMAFMSCAGDDIDAGNGC